MGRRIVGTFNNAADVDIIELINHEVSRLIVARSAQVGSPSGRQLVLGLHWPLRGDNAKKDRYGEYSEGHTESVSVKLAGLTAIGCQQQYVYEADVFSGRWR